MRNFWSILFVIIAAIVLLWVIRVLFSISIALFKLALPILLIGFAIYGVSQYLQNRR